MNTAKAVGTSMPISMKHSVEVCNMIRGKNLQKAKKLLNEVIDFKRAVPYRRFGKDTPHKPGIGAGRYPINTITEILKIIESAEANAQFKGLNTNNLVIAKIVPNKASEPYRAGRQRGRKAKRAHLEVIVEERKTEAKSKEDKK
jgi:large subunit ribosomal protein L22